ncbi:MAG: hypothetical protein ABSH20_25830, partial [Tepidisphaeraceae bacterium]
MVALTVLAESEPSIADTLYRRFFTGAITLVLTAGASWGVWILWQIGRAAKFNGAALQDVNAHGQAQIYGWMGLFIMGFAYQAFPQVWHTQLVAPRAAVGVFLAMVTGVILRTFGMTLGSGSGTAILVAMLGCGLQVVAILTFAFQIIATFRRSLTRMDPYIGFIFGGLFWFVAMSLLDSWHTYATLSAKTREELLWHVATYQAPLRDMQIHGLAMFMILGVSIRKLPGFFGVPATPRRRGWWALAILSVAVVAECVLFVAYRWSGSHILAAFLMIPW